MLNEELYKKRLVKPRRNSKEARFLMLTSGGGPSIASPTIGGGEPGDGAALSVVSAMFESADALARARREGSDDEDDADEALNYDIEGPDAKTAMATDGGGGAMLALSLYSKQAPPDLAVRSLKDIAAFAGLPLSELPRNPFEVLAELPTQVIGFLLAPVPLPGEEVPDDDEALQFHRAMLANGVQSKPALRRHPTLKLDERQRDAERAPPRTLTTLPRTTSSHPMPFREHAAFKTGLGARNLPGLRSTDPATGEVTAPPPRPKRRGHFNVEVIEDVLTNPRRLTHGRPHPESFSRPRSRQSAQRDDMLQIRERAKRYADPRRRITSLEVHEILTTWGKTGNAEETMRPLDVMLSRGGSDDENEGDGDDDGEVYGEALVHPGRHEHGFNPQFLTRESKRRHWGGQSALNPLLPEMSPVCSPSMGWCNGERAGTTERGSVIASTTCF